MYKNSYVCIAEKVHVCMIDFNHRNSTPIITISIIEDIMLQLCNMRRGFIITILANLPQKMINFVYINCELGEVTILNNKYQNNYHNNMAIYRVTLAGR